MKSLLLSSVSPAATTVALAASLLAISAPCALADTGSGTNPTPPPTTSQTTTVSSQPAGRELSHVAPGYVPGDHSDPTKKARAQDHFRKMKAQEASITGVGGVPSAKVIDAISVAGQPNDYYCGPATLISLSRGRGVWLTWDQAAGSLGTTTDGTAWYDGSYPMANALNSWIPGWNYGPVGFSYASDSVIQTYEQNLTYNVSNGWGLAGNAWEDPNYPDYYLNGHPRNQTIYHWFAIRGYYSSGDGTHYVDSAYTLWSTVPQASGLSSYTIAHAMGGRGYVW